MTEETLKHLTMEGLSDLLVLSVQEFLDAMETKDEIATKVKKKQLELLLRVIVAKKVGLSRRPKEV